MIELVELNGNEYKITASEVDAKIGDEYCNKCGAVLEGISTCSFIPRQPSLKIKNLDLDKIISKSCTLANRLIKLANLQRRASSEPQICYKCYEAMLVDIQDAQFERAIQTLDDPRQPRAPGCRSLLEFEDTEEK